MKRLLAALLLGPFVAVSAPLAQAQVAPGSYIMEGGFGALTVTNGAFKIETVGGNGHTCSVEGTLKGSTGRAEDEGDVCLVKFSTRGGSVEVKPTTPDICRNYCGVRAYFEGTYLKPAPGCADAERARTRKAFKTAYDAKDYAKAQELIGGQLKACEKTLGWLETAGVRNDLAITQFHLGAKAECLKTLQPLSEDAGKKDEALAEDYPPSDWDSYAPYVRAARKNLSLCRG